MLRQVEDFTEDDVMNRLSVVERELDRIRDIRDEYQDGVEEFIDVYKEHMENDPNRTLENWRRDISEVGAIVKQHAHKIREKKTTLENAVSQARSLEIQ